MTTQQLKNLADKHRGSGISLFEAVQREQTEQLSQSSQLQPAKSLNSTTGRETRYEQAQPQINAHNLISVKTLSMPYPASLGDNQHWQFNEKTIQIIEDNTVIRTFIKTSLQFVRVGDTTFLYPFLKPINSV